MNLRCNIDWGFLAFLILPLDFNFVNFIDGVL
jgi:hypothetical protein